MSILGYSASYFLPQYWSGTPLYGEKIIPLLDYVLSSDYQHADRLALAFYDIENKYKNTGNLPIDKLEAIVEESGYGYIKNLLAPDEDSLRLLVYILVMIHELKGSKKGIETVLELLRTKEDAMELHILGDLHSSVESPGSFFNFSTNNFIMYSNFTVGDDSFDLSFNIRTGDNFNEPQCIASSNTYGFYLGIDDVGRIILRVGENTRGTRAWQTINDKTRFISNKVLSPNTSYKIRFRFSGYNYVVGVEHNENYSQYLSVDSAQGLGITGGSIALGLDVSTGTLQYPFNGLISIGTFNFIANNIKVTQWFETFPVGIEDTFSVDADLDVSLISEDFFVRFAKFVERYVYPSLRAFRVKMGLKAKITFLPWVRQKVNYVASNIGSDGYENFNVLTEDSTQERELYGVQDPVLYAWSYDDEHFVYTKVLDIYSVTTLYNKDNTIYRGDEFKIEPRVSTGEVTYEITYNEYNTHRATQEDIYAPVPFQTISNDD